MRRVTPPKGSRFGKATYGTRSVVTNSQSLRDRIHPNQYIIGGAHDKGLRHASAGRVAGGGYFARQIADGNIRLEKSANGRMRYFIKSVPTIACGCCDELALLRAQHFLRDNQNKWMTRAKFEQQFCAIYDTFVDKFKCG